MTVLFCDLRGFTALSEHLPPTTVRVMLDHYYDRVTELVLAMRSTLMKYVGDEVFAVWGAPIPSADHPTRVGVRDGDPGAHPRLNTELLDKDAPEVSFGIGLNTGEAVAAHFGGRRRRQYDVVGDTVNVGARLCSAAGRRDHPLRPGARPDRAPTAGRAGGRRRAQRCESRAASLAIMPESGRLDDSGVLAESPATGVVGIGLGPIIDRTEAARAEAGGVPGAPRTGLARTASCGPACDRPPPWWRSSWSPRACRWSPRRRRPPRAHGASKASPTRDQGPERRDPEEGLDGVRRGQGRSEAQAG